jgi:cell division transport system permease protein
VTRSVIPDDKKKTMTKFYRAIKIAFQYMFRNFGLSFASIVVMTLSFFIVSIVGLAFYGSYELARFVDSKPGLVIYLRGDLTESQAKEFEDIVKATGLTREIVLKDLEYTREDFSMRIPDKELNENILGVETSAFLPRLTFVYADSQENLKQLITILEKNENFMENIVDTKNLDRQGWYSFDQKQANVIRDANNLITLAGGIITAFLFVISSILIYITIKLTVNYHKKEIEIMDLVGADGWFIRFPFVLDGIIYGVLGAFLSTSIIFLFQSLLLNNSTSFISTLASFFGEVNWPELNFMLVLDLYLSTMVVGAIVGALSSFFAILKYVKK